MRALFTPLCLGAALTFPLTGAAIGGDQIAASFERMLHHGPVATTPAAPTAREDDPLHAHLTMVLWERHLGWCGPPRTDVAAVALRSAP